MTPTYANIITICVLSAPNKPINTKSTDNMDIKVIKWRNMDVIVNSRVMIISD